MKKWLEGPEFLTKPCTEWPTNMLSNLTLPEEFISAKKQTVYFALESRFTGELNSIDRLINLLFIQTETFDSLDFDIQILLVELQQF